MNVTKEVNKVLFIDFVNSTSIRTLIADLIGISRVKINSQLSLCKKGDSYLILRVYFTMLSYQFDQVYCTKLDENMLAIILSPIEIHSSRPPH